MHDPLARAAAWLRCPVCGAGMAVSGGALRCTEGHSFDIARQGYVNLLPGNARPGRNADTPDMVAARQRFLGAGHYGPLADRLADLAAAATTAGDGLVLDAGAGSGEYLAAVLDRLATATGLALDLSAAAVRRAARAHCRAASVVTDLRGRLPVADGAADVVLNVFSPRNAAEYHRVLRPGGALLVATPGDGHLAELVDPLGLVSVDPDKGRRLERSLGGWFTRTDHGSLRLPLQLARHEVVDLALMGPSAHHVDPAALRERVDALPEPVAVTAAFTVSAYRTG